MSCSDWPGLGALPEDLLHLILKNLTLHSFSIVSQVCRHWAAVLRCPLPWKQVAERNLYLLECSKWTADRRVVAAGGWKELVRRNLELERLWVRAGDATEAGHVGVLNMRRHSDHRHWVPTILLNKRNRGFVTCSYDGTIRFWKDVDVLTPTCVKVLSGVDNEGFSCIGMLEQEEGKVHLVAGSELGNVHIWEVPAFSAI